MRTLIAVLALLLITAPVYGQRHLVGGSGSSHKGGHYESGGGAGGADDAASVVIVFILVSVFILVLAVLASSGAFKPKTKLVVWRGGLPHCPKCGQQVSLKAARPRCRACGHNLMAPTPPAVSPTKPVPPKPAPVQVQPQSLLAEQSLTEPRAVSSAGHTRQDPGKASTSTSDAQVLLKARHPRLMRLLEEKCFKNFKSLGFKSNSRPNYSVHLNIISMIIDLL